jgi:hypothetical protein
MFISYVNWSPKGILKILCDVQCLYGIIGTASARAKRTEEVFANTTFRHVV